MPHTTLLICLCTGVWAHGLCVRQTDRSHDVRSGGRAVPRRVPTPPGRGWSSLPGAPPDVPGAPADWRTVTLRLADAVFCARRGFGRSLPRGTAENRVARRRFSPSWGPEPGATCAGGFRTPWPRLLAEPSRAISSFNKRERERVLNTSLEWSYTHRCSGPFPELFSLGGLQCGERIN